MSKCYLLLMMGGSGTRFGADIPKQFIKVAGKPIFSYILEKYDDCVSVDGVVVVCNASWVEYASSWINGLKLRVPVKVVAGGASRSESVRNGLMAVAKYAKDEDVILIHDATHPYVDEYSIPEAIEATKEYGGATMGEFQYDTVYQMSSETHIVEGVIPRESVVSGASPEAFLFGRLFPIYVNASIDELEQYTSAGALALAYDIPMKVVSTNLINLKITYRHDMEAFRKLFHNYYF